MSIADTGHTATHAPQPVQRSRATTATAAPPSAGTNRIARASQRSAHERHTTRFRARQFAAIVAFSDFDAARIHDPTVTVVDNDPVELGRRGAELALQRLDGYRGPSRLVCIDTPIIERESHLVGAR